MEKEFKKWLRETALSLSGTISTASVQGSESQVPEDDFLLGRLEAEQAIAREQQRLFQEQQRLFQEQVQRDVQTHQQFMDQVQQQQFMDFSRQSVTPVDQGGILPPSFM